MGGKIGLAPDDLAHWREQSERLVQPVLGSQEMHALCLILICPGQNVMVITF
jgi:hypothetical protein